MNLVLDDAYQFGLGAFETICLKNGEPEFLDWHLERLEHSLKYLGIEQKITESEVRDWLTAQQDIPALHAMKIMVSGKNRLMVLRDNPYTQDRIRQGFRLAYSKILRNQTSPLVYHKTMNYGDNILEKRRTHGSDIDEYIFLNTRGEICEGSTTNIFFRDGGQIYTPPVSCGLLPGIMRRYVMETMDVKEIILRPEDAAQMESCFVTNSLMGIMPAKINI